MAKAKTTKATALWQPKPKRKNKGVHSKNNKPEFFKKLQARFGELKSNFQ